MAWYLLTFNTLVFHMLHGIIGVRLACGVNLGEDDFGVLALVWAMEETLSSINVSHGGNNDIVWLGDIVVEQAVADSCGSS